MTDKAIKTILTSAELTEIENAITKHSETYVNKEYIDFTVNILRGEIENSGLTIDYIRNQLLLKKTQIIKLGINILETLKNKPIEEEYPKGEEIPNSEKSIIISSHGIGIGFGIKYAIYLDFLENRPKELLDYIKKDRIPKADKFYKSLVKLYNS